MLIALLGLLLSFPLRWVPQKRIFSASDAGQLTYFISGFLTLQLEFQNFLANLQRDATGLGTVLPTHVFSSLSVPLLLQLEKYSYDFAKSLASARSSEDVFHAVVNATREVIAVVHRHSSVWY